MIATAALLLGYWAACVAFGDYSLEGWFGTAVDRAVLGPAHLYRGEGVPFDPEGLMSTFPAVAQVLLGWWVGERLRGAGAPDRGLVLRLALAAFGLLLLGLAWALAMPVNKKIWTSSYVLLTTALAIATLALLVLLIEVRGGGRRLAAWARFFELFGRNALFVFVLSGLVPRFLTLIRWPDEGTTTTPPRWLYEHAFAGIGSDPRLGSLLFALLNVAAYAAVAWALDRRGIYIRA